MALASKVAFITGGASGLGRATAERFLRNGARVAVVDLPDGPGAEFAESAGANAIFCPTDITSEEQVAAALEATTSKFGALTTTVNCAGVASAVKVLGKKVHPLDLFARTLTVNTVGTFNVCRLASEVMAAAEPYDESGERGVIVNTASIAAFDGQVGQAAYSASKGAVVGMMLPLARELAAHGIRVCTIAPGVFFTPMLAGLPEKAQKSLAAAVPFPKRLGDPDEFGAMVQTIVENQMLNGEVIRLDGALRMQ